MHISFSVFGRVQLVAVLLLYYCLRPQKGNFYLLQAQIKVAGSGIELEVIFYYCTWSQLSMYTILQKVLGHCYTHRIFIAIPLI